MASPAVSKSQTTPQRSVQTASVNGSRQLARTPSRSHADPAPAAVTPSASGDSSTSSQSSWGSHFWVTLIDPQTGASFFACPGTGQVSWDPPVGNYVMPPSTEGEWWELADESRDSLPYYYHTKTHATVWDRPDGFVIPLGILQNTAAGNRLSWSLLNGGNAPNGYTADVSSSSKANTMGNTTTSQSNTPSRSKSHNRTGSGQSATSAHSTSSRGSAHATGATPSKNSKRPAPSAPPAPAYRRGTTLSTIPGSPDMTDASGDDGGAGAQYTVDEQGRLQLLAPAPGSPGVPNARSGSSRPGAGPSPLASTSSSNGPSRPRSQSYTSLPHMAATTAGHTQAPGPSYAQQSLTAAVETVISTSTPPSPIPSRRSFGFRTRKSVSSPDVSPRRGRSNTETQRPPMPEVPTTPPKKGKGKDKERSQTRPSVPAMPDLRSWKSRNGSSVAVNISAPVLNQEATANMSAVKMKSKGQPIPTGASASASTRPILPDDLVSDIEQFIEEDYARQYFSTHRAGFIFKRKVPLMQLMTWQKPPLNLPLLLLNKSLHKDALKSFRAIQRIMGDREQERPSTNRAPSSNTQSFQGRVHHEPSSPTLEEARCILTDGISHGELRDEIYCQLMKQLNGNPSTESAFKGWQFMCVLLITFPPSKNFESSLRAFIQQHTAPAHAEGRIDVIAKHCVGKLEYISKKGPRGKPPTPAEIESALDSAFNPSIFGEPLDAIVRLQERSYPSAKVPIILPFLADGIIALGGLRAEGIFRVPGDGDAVSALRVRLDRGQYALGEIDDPHVLASLLKLWLRELREPLVPAEMYDACVSCAQVPEACVEMVRRLPSVHRRVVLFVVSFLQLFLDARTQEVTKMTPVNLALVMAPNLLRCESESMAVVFTNAQFEQMFVYNLLLHLKPKEIDSDYQPTHGTGARAKARNM